MVNLTTARRYRVLGPPPADLDKMATLAIRRYSWRPICDMRGERESFGWVDPRNVLASMFTWEDLVLHPYVLLGIRQDRKKFSSVLFRARRDAIVREVCRQKKVQRLSRAHCIAIEEELTVTMLKETTPTSAFCNVVWDLNSGIVYVAAAGEKVCERIQEMFEGTFDLKLQPILPALTAAAFVRDHGLDEEFHLANAAAEEADR